MSQDGSTERDNVKLSPEEARELIKAIEDVEREEAHAQDVAKKAS